MLREMSKWSRAPDANRSGSNKTLGIPAAGRVYYCLRYGVRYAKSLFLDEGALKRKYGVWLVCLFLFIAAVDTIPDPPAINSHASRNCGMYSPHVRGSFTPLEKEWYLTTNSVRPGPIHWFSLRLVLNNEPLAECPLSLVHHGTDTSPPAYS